MNIAKPHSFNLTSSYPHSNMVCEPETTKVWEFCKQNTEVTQSSLLECETEKMSQENKRDRCLWPYKIVAIECIHSIVIHIQCNICII